MRPELIMSNRLPVLVALVLIQAPAATTAAQPADIWVPPSAKELKVGTVRMRDGLTHIVSFRGQVEVSGTVRYGWLEGSGTELEMQFEPSASGARKLPRYRQCVSGICAASFTIENPNSIALSIFGPAAVSDLRARRALTLQASTTLRLQDLSFGNDCGVHYTASAAATESVKPENVAALEVGVSGHC